jgi:uncharacterized protein
MQGTRSALAEENMQKSRMTVRAMPFSFADKNKHWNSQRPEFSQIVNSASLAMPYLEPYLIRSMRAARGQITDPALQEELDQYVKQEAAHYKQHRRFNDTLRAAGYQCIDTLEQTLADDYEALEQRRSLRFNLAYAEGFESMALAIGQMLIEEREYLFRNSEPAVASLVLWHFVEEIEHKNVAFDVLHHLHPGYLLRITGLVYATVHIMLRTRQGYKALLREDKLWQAGASRWALAKVLIRIFRSLIPKLLRILKPGYHPSQITDPTWGQEWAQLFGNSPEGAANLDTTQLHQNSPVAC